MSRTAFTAAIALAAGVAVAPPAESATIRGHSVPGRSGRVIHHGHHGGFFVSYSYLPYYYAPYAYPYGYYGPAYYGPGYAPEVAYVDTDISPEDAAVYLDGEYMGEADDYDGWPAYLPLEPGRHTLTFKAEGYAGVTRKIRVPRGAVLGLQFTLRRGASPEEPADADLEIAVPEPPRPQASLDERENRSPEREEGPEEPGEPAPREADEAEPGGASSRLRLRVTPDDASVYVDGEFIGTGRTLNGLHGDLKLAAGEHRVEVVRPGYRSVTRSIRLREGQRLALELDLERPGPSGAGRR